MLDAYRTFAVLILIGAAMVATTSILILCMPAPDERGALGALTGASIAVAGFALILLVADAATMGGAH